MVNRSGGSRTTDSPSMPVATGAADATSNSGVDHSSHPSKRESCPSAFSDLDRQDAEQPRIEPGA